MTEMVNKRLVMVIEELRSAPAHSQDIADALNITVKSASAHLSELHDMGMVRPVGKMRLTERGPHSTIYEVVA